MKIAFSVNSNLKEETQSTQLFIGMIDTFFDCLNVRRLGQDAATKKPELAPYRDQSDWRFAVSTYADQTHMHGIYLFIESCMPC